MNLIDIDQMKRLAQYASPGPWQWWTSNSSLRLTSAAGQDGDVLHSYVHSGVADVACNTFNRAYIQAAHPAQIMAMIKRIEAADHLLRVLQQCISIWEVDEEDPLTDALEEAIARYVGYSSPMAKGVAK